MRSSGSTVCVSLPGACVTYVVVQFLVDYCRSVRTEICGASMARGEALIRANATQLRYCTNYAFYVFYA